MLEEALQGIQVLEDTQEKGIPFESGDRYQSLLDKSAQKTTQNWIDYYKPAPIVIKALKEQKSNIQKEFTNWYHDNQSPDHNDNTILRMLSKIINEQSDQYRTPKTTKLGRGARLYLHPVRPRNFLSTLRMLTESGGVIRYVFLLSAGLRQDILDVRGGGRPVFSSWSSWDLEVNRAAMSLDQSQLATSSGVGSSGWTVCYSGDKSRDSGMAISWVGRQVGLHRSVFAMIVMLSAYLSVS